MPKNKTDKPLSLKKRRASPYPCTSKNAENYRSKETQLKLVGFDKEWEEARCPVCMEHPHNAVLLSCSSRNKGCRPFMCDTSYRHSNCLDQFIKSSPATSSTPPSSVNPRGGGAHSTKLVCPLCRGEINGWEVIEPARRFMNLKLRSCSTETCNFSGNYSELRKHARLEHPSVRPSEVDPSRQRDWTRLERERDFEDVLSAYQLPSGDLLSEDVLFYELRDLEDALSTINSEPEDGLTEDYNLFVDFELDFTFLNPFFTSNHFEPPSQTYLVAPTPSNNPLRVLQGFRRSNRRRPRDPRPI